MAMTKEIFTSNVRSLTFSMFLKATIVAGFISFFGELVLVVLFKQGWPSWSFQDTEPLRILGIFILSILFFIVLRGFVGHLNPRDAFRKAFSFFFVFHIVLNGLGVFYGDTPPLFALGLSMVSALGNATGAYFLANRYPV